MRSWQIPNSDTFNQIKAPIKLDRRSQLSETWLEDEQLMLITLQKSF